ncbi:TlpA family protein disulfide reductase [Carboxylicivirga sp. RSCT41]|uniref:TlpA family protein disulfide reductase n=1 Tax=Carboxylicivirga agarovorans TaxID=3417570 RepID=UPI003D32B4F5
MSVLQTQINKVIILALMVMVGAACSSQPTSFKIVKNGEGVSIPFIMAGQEKIKVEFNENNEFTLDITQLETPFLVRYPEGRSMNYAYVNEGSAQVINISKDGATHTGDNAEYANYLNTREVVRVELLKTDSETVAIAKVKETFEINIAGLEKQNLDDVFTTNQETYFTYLGAIKFLNWLKTLPNAKELSDDSPGIRFIEEMLSQKGVMNSTYQSYAKGALEFLAGRTWKEGDTVLDWCEQIVNLSFRLVEKDGGKDVMVNNSIHRHVKYCGINGMKPIIDKALSKMTNPTEIDKLKALYASWEHLEPGMKSHSFSYDDINGNKVSLSDFEGKYVYIDMWATWCTPCVKEIPYVQELEKEFHGQDIVFVSISSDENMDKWKKKVLGDNLKGIHLIDGGDKEFAQFLNVKGIPHFVLIGKNGEIIDAKCTRPSDPKTRTLLENLLKN